MTVARSPARQWTGPIVLAVITVAGLLSALIGEGGIWWVFSWVALAVPCVCSVFYLIRGTLGPSARKRTW
ncbi:hypothetical protein IVB30_37130 [Bradyrhizobium sp. 200]|uniref:hypothetical protein n=1 Tax=Bradyrhizobium sp. 200 TaxID=2782665 RepID=UPI001FFEFD7A|nr:hypothetical protein [Bradyrhizobium sp. 200]UPJ48600.1 hypothetical protein IVB30_37130 [Bradyrhizobium sp. 200]